jgi:hypothetical protein
MRYSDYEQRQMDIASGEELDRQAERKARDMEKLLRDLFESLSLVTALLHDRNTRDGGTETSLQAVADAEELLANRYETVN